MDIKNYDIIVVGCGFAGSVIANLAAKESKRVLILERRNHIAGNMYDEIDKETGILVQKYGPHSFHTQSDTAYDFVTNVGEWYPFTLTARVNMLNKITPSPFNFKTIDDFFDSKKAHTIKKHLVDKYRYESKASIVDLLNSDDEVIKEYADFLFEHDYLPYTTKQWNITPDELDISVLQRVPVRFDYTDRYFDDRYQMMPENGFTYFFSKLLDSPLIDIKLNCDALSLIRISSENEIYFNDIKLDIPLIYTGATDELFEFKFGKLPYRSLKFEYKTINTDSFQETPGVAHPKAEGYTRITEYTKLPVQTNTKTIIAYEYPLSYDESSNNEPYYPVLTESSQNCYSDYLLLANKINNLYLCGRLADFKYYNMDAVILKAIETFNKIKFKE